MHQRIKYDVLSQKELEYMKGRLEQILIERGVHLDHEEMLKALEEKGCIVDMEARDVRFTKELIDKAIAAVPAEFTLYSPDGKHDLKFPSPDGRFYTRTCTGAPNYRNIKNETHYIKPEEEREWYHLTNKMENLDYVTLPPSPASTTPAMRSTFTFSPTLSSSPASTSGSSPTRRTTYSFSSTWPRRPSAATTSSASARSSA